MKSFLTIQQDKEEHGNWKPHAHGGAVGCLLCAAAGGGRAVTYYIDVKLTNGCTYKERIDSKNIRPENKPHIPRHILWLFTRREQYKIPYAATLYVDSWTPLPIRRCLPMEDDKRRRRSCTVLVRWLLRAGLVGRTQAWAGQRRIDSSSCPGQKKKNAYTRCIRHSWDMLKKKNQAFMGVGNKNGTYQKLWKFAFEPHDVDSRGVHGRWNESWNLSPTFLECPLRHIYQFMNKVFKSRLHSYIRYSIYQVWIIANRTSLQNQTIFYHV